MITISNRLIGQNDVKRFQNKYSVNVIYQNSFIKLILEISKFDIWGPGTAIDLPLNKALLACKFSFYIIINSCYCNDSEIDTIIIIVLTLLYL